MSEWLMRLLELQIQASVLILGILLVRRLVRGRISPRLQYGLWGVAALRLLIPFSLRSRFSLLNMLQLSSGGEAGLLPAQAGGATVPPNVPVYSEPVFSPAPEAAQLPHTLPDIQQLLSNEAKAGAVPAAQWANWANDVAVLLAIGVLVCLGYAIVVNWKFHRRYVWPANRLDISCELPVLLSPDVGSPCLVGTLRPVLLLNDTALEPPRRRQLAIAHELAHYRRKDHWVALLRAMLCAAYWYNPLVWLAAKASQEDCELACDAAVMRGFSQAQCEEYGLALLSMIPGGRAQGLSCATSMTGSKRTLKQRVAFIGKRPRTVAAIALLVAVSMLALCLFACTGALEEGLPGVSGASVQIAEDGLTVPVQEVQGLDINDEKALGKSFGMYLQQTAYQDIPVISFGKTVRMEGMEAQAISKQGIDVYFDLWEYIVDAATGGVKFRASEAHLGGRVPVSVHASEAGVYYEFQMEHNMSALFSSSLEDYEPGATLRGFVATLRWREPGQQEDATHAYVFMLRSDAHAFEGEQDLSTEEEEKLVYVGAGLPYDLVLLSGQQFSSADMEAVVGRMRTDSYDKEKFDERIAAGKRVKIYAFAPFEGGTLVLAGLPTEGEFMPDLFYVKDGEVQTRTYGAGYESISYARFMGHTIVFGPSFAWDSGAPLPTTHATATFFDGQQATCQMLSTPERSGGYLLAVPGDTWLKSLQLYDGNALVADEKSRRSSTAVVGRVEYDLLSDSTLSIRNDTNLCSMYVFAAMQSSYYNTEGAACYLDVAGEKVPLQYWQKNAGLQVQDIWRSANNINETAVTAYVNSPAVLHGLEREEILGAYWVNIIRDTGGEAHALQDISENTQVLNEGLDVQFPHMYQDVFMLVLETEEGYYTARMVFLK